jgi:hypothetical protein
MRQPVRAKNRQIPELESEPGNKNAKNTDVA